MVKNLLNNIQSLKYDLNEQPFPGNLIAVCFFWSNRRNVPNIIYCTIALVDFVTAVCMFPLGLDITGSYDHQYGYHGNNGPESRWGSGPLFSS